MHHPITLTGPGLQLWAIQNFQLPPADFDQAFMAQFARRQGDRFAPNAQDVGDLAAEDWPRAYALTKRGFSVTLFERQLAELRRDPVLSMSSLESADEDETSGATRELMLQAIDDATPEALLASKEIAQAVNAAMASAPPCSGTTSAVSVPW